MSKRIVFFSAFHNGDIHASRGFVRQIIKKVHQIDSNTQFAYGHKNSPDILADISELSFDPNVFSVIKDEHINLHSVGDTTYINTWYAQQHFRYMSKYGITLDSLYAAFNDTCKALWKFELKDISEDPAVFFPVIDYSKFYFQNAQDWIISNTGKKIFVSNGEVLSGQAHNFAMAPMIDRLARKHTDKIFILSNNESFQVHLPNVFYSKNIINKVGNDLNENAFISEYCDTIIGRASGTFAFSQTANNMLKRKCKMLCFTNLSTKKFWLSDLLQDKINYSADITISNESNLDLIQNLMESHI